MRRELLWVLVCGLGACAGPRPGTPDDAPTLASLATRSVEIPPDPGIVSDEKRAKEAYRRFLESSPRAAQRPQALRRLGDLEMDDADTQAASGRSAGGEPDYRVAIARYQDFLKAYPDDPDNDRVLYQLARAQEQGGALEAALGTLDRLVTEHPKTGFHDEAHFRRGELLFTLRDYRRAEKAYAQVLEGERYNRNPYIERSQYMQGWSQFKQGRLEDAIGAFLGVLDRRAAALRSPEALEKIPRLTRADRELVEDTFRVLSLSLASLQGAESIPAHMADEVRQTYEFRVYQQLGELYLRQDRTKDAADTLGAFARRHPLHAQAPVLQARVIEIYQGAGFASLALDAKKAYVSRYGVDSEFRRANPEGWYGVQPLVKTHLGELARHHHAAAQKSHQSADAQEAVRWYRSWIASFPDDAQAPQNHFLLAELLFEDRRYAEAAVEYDKTAYGYPLHPRSADAGYAALLALAEQERRAAPAEQAAIQRASVDSATRFAASQRGDPRVAPVLARAAEQLFALREGERAAALAKQVLALQPPAAAAQRRVAWTVLAHTAFDRGEFDAAERGYAEVLAVTPAQEATRRDIVERQAAAIYQQGEAARAGGRDREAIGHFERVASVAPQSAVQATAQYDAAAARIALKDWDGAIRTLEDFRQRHPGHALGDEVGAKLAVAYLESGRSAQAAAELERIAATQKDPKLARETLWQAAELHDRAAEKGGGRSAAANAYLKYLRLYPEPLPPAVEARWRLAQIARAEGNAARELALMREIFQADQSGGAARTERTRALGASAALALARPALDDYRKVALVEPLAKNLKLKKSRLEDVLKAYAVATDYGVAEVTTAATFHVAALYQDFGKALLVSQRPKKLSKAELEQYNVMLEEQAFPFEEKAIGLHEINARRAADGLYDEWVRSSFRSLAELRPVRYGKAERATPEAGAVLAEQLNQQGIAHRQQGRFAQAREAYDRAIALDPAFAAPVLNLAILHDLYLGDRTRALELYERYLAMVPPAEAGAVSKWVVDLRNRKAADKAAFKESS